MRHVGYRFDITATVADVVRCFDEGGEVVIQVDDDGPGYRSRSASGCSSASIAGRGAKEGGCGLGLPIVLALA